MSKILCEHCVHCIHEEIAENGFITEEAMCKLSKEITDYVTGEITHKEKCRDVNTNGYCSNYLKKTNWQEYKSCVGFLLLILIIFSTIIAFGLFLS